MITRKQRRELILGLVERNEIENQDQLLALLEVEGVQTTQATISRDLPLNRPGRVGRTAPGTRRGLPERDCLQRLS
jgi:hypothetical protein